MMYDHLCFLSAGGPEHATPRGRQNQGTTTKEQNKERKAKIYFLNLNRDLVRSCLDYMHGQPYEDCIRANMGRMPQLTKPVDTVIQPKVVGA